MLSLWKPVVEHGPDAEKYIMNMQLRQRAGTKASVCRDVEMVGASDQHPLSTLLTIVLM